MDTYERTMAFLRSGAQHGALPHVSPPPPRSVTIAEAALSVARDQVAASLAAGVMAGRNGSAADVVALFREFRGLLYPPTA